MGAKSGGAVGWEVIVRTGDCVVGALGARTMRPRVSLLVVACFVDGAGSETKSLRCDFFVGVPLCGLVRAWPRYGGAGALFDEYM